MTAASLERWFGFTERHTDLATEVRAGVTTFMVMAYIIFVNPIILGFTGVPGLDGKGLPFAATLTVTCLTAGLLSIAMGLVSNYPFALAAGMGLNAVVAFELVAGRGLTWPQAMTVVFLEGLVITVLVLTRFREAVMDAVPIGLLHLGPGGEARVRAPAGRPRGVPRPADRDLRHRILPHGVADGAPDARRPAPGHSRDDRDRDRPQRGLRRGPGIRDARGRLRGANRVLLVDSLGAMFGGLANSSSNTTYIESAAGVADGARTGLAPVVTGLLFLAAMFFAPLASVIPAQATAPALIIVGFFMMGIVRDIPWDDYEQAIPAFMTMLAMPFTWSITNGGRELHWMIYLAFTVYFCLPLIESAAK